MLPKLSEIFGISVDALLGITPAEPEKVLETELVTEEPEAGPGHKWEFQWDAGRKSNIGLAIWIILTAGWMFIAAWCHIDADFWDLLWTNGLIVYGFLGLSPKFSFFRLGCILFGAQGLLKELNALPDFLRKELLLPAILLLFGLSLLADALRKSHKPHFSVTHNGKTVHNSSATCNMDGDTFDCDCAFGERTQLVTLPVLRHGDVAVSFGHLTLDLTPVEHFDPQCSLDADCAFGELTVLVPRHIRAEVDSNTAFGSVDIQSSPAPETAATIHIDANASFGQITVKYI